MLQVDRRAFSIIVRHQINEFGDWVIVAKIVWQRPHTVIHLVRNHGTCHQEVGETSGIMSRGRMSTSISISIKICVLAL